MATSPTRSLSPLPSRGDGLGIFPSGESLNRSSTYSQGHTRSSTCTVLSYTQHFEQDTNRSTAALTRTTATRTNLKEIQKSPLPHRFHLVPSSKKRPQDRPTLIPRSMTQWNWKTRRQDGEDGHPPSSPRLYEEDTGTQAPDSVITGEEEKHSILEDLISDAFDSPVFDCLSTPNPNAACTHSPQSRASFTPTSFTLVQDQPSHKARRLSAALDSIQKLSTLSSSQDSQSSVGRQLQRDFPPSASWSTAQFDVDTHSHRDSASGRLAFPHISDDNIQEIASLSATAHRESSERSRGRRSSSSSSINSLIGGRPDSSGSVYSQPSISPHDSLAGLVTSRPATQSSFASTASSDDSRRRKFAARRQAIYAEFGFKLPIPDSESSSSLRHTHIPTGSSKPFNGAGSSRTTSAYVPLRSAWSTSTSAASVRSQLLDQADASPNDDPDPASQILPYSSSINLANLANDKLERFSVQDSFLSSSRNPLLQDRANFTTSTPPAKRRSHRSLAKLGFDSLPDVPALPDFIKRPTMSRHASGFGWQPCAPLRLAKLDIDGGSTIRQSLSTSERVQMFAKWRDHPEYHPIVKELMDDVDKAISEWSRGCPIVA
ncbi:hypothetical protein BD311DRAFT_370941 [Dichomitus squalens]|uniref:Uncharacterized protein n=1 Tax=Dichomitus squalens TaxID=114155 RepID=A0A4Q9MJL5_9APHY|nr:hypothetical protein BD311DRAFT_370941 [Dichomitus squalens]